VTFARRRGLKRVERKGASDLGNGRNGRRRLRKLIETWVSFGEFLKTGLGKDGVQRAQEERFLALKARIAHLLPVLTVVQRGSVSDPEALAAVRDITEMLNFFTTLSTPEPLTKEEVDEVIAQWHRIFIFLNKLEGALKDRSHGFLMRAESVGDLAGTRGRFAGGLVRFLLAFVTVVGAGVLIVGLLGITPEQAMESLERAGGLILGEGTTGPAVARNDERAVSESGSDESIAPGSDAKEGNTQAEGKPFIRTKEVERKKGRVPVAMRPVLREYGRHLTMILFAILLGAIVLLFFLRVR
jgi:hypothetical protein